MPTLATPLFPQQGGDAGRNPATTRSRVRTRPHRPLQEPFQRTALKVHSFSPAATTNRIEGASASEGWGSVLLAQGSSLFTGCSPVPKAAQIGQNFTPEKSFSPRLPKNPLFSCVQPASESAPKPAVLYLRVQPSEGLAEPHNRFQFSVCSFHNQYRWYDFAHFCTGRPLSPDHFPVSLPSVSFSGSKYSS